MPSNVVDDRIVKVEFDNDGFEDGVSSSLSSLDKFEKGLLGLEKGKFGDGIADNFSSIQDTIDSTDMSPISDALDSVGKGFSVLETIAVGALLRIGSKVADLGLEIASSLTVDPVAQGFQKYTSATKDVKAIMNQSGKSIDEVTEKLEGLSWYSDATSYSYNAMVSALKNFSSQGISIDESIPMLMGLGNSLSYAGLAAEEASGAFNIYSKAISTGYMQLKEWRSLSYMNATTEDLKKRYMEAAVEAGTLIKVNEDLYRVAETGLDVDFGTFEQSLGNQKGKWLTTAVMKKVLGEVYGGYASSLYEFSKAEENAGLSVNELMERFDALNGVTDEYGKRTFLASQEARTFGEAVNAVADAASSAWKKIFENVLGNAEESTELWTDFSDLLYGVFMGPLEGLTNLTTAWNMLGGRTELIQGIYNLFGSLSTVIGPIKEAFGEVFNFFGAGVAEKIFAISKEFKNWAFFLQLTDDEQQKVHDVALSLAKVLGLLANGLGTFLGHVKNLIKAFSPLIVVFGNFIYYLTLIGRSIRDAFSNADIAPAYTIGNAISWLTEKIERLAKFIDQNLKKATAKIIEFINAFKKNGGVESIVESINKLNESGQNVVQAFLDSFSGSGASIAKAIREFAKSVFETIKNAFSKKEKSPEIEQFGGSVVQELISSFRGHLSNVSSGVAQLISTVIEGISDGLPIIQNAIQGLVKNIAGFITETSGTILDAITAFISSIAPHISKLIIEIFSAGSSILSGIKTSGVISAFITSLVDLIGDFIPVIVSGISGLIAGAINALNDALPRLLEAAGKVIHTVSEFIGGPVKDDLLSILGSIGSVLLKAAISFLPAIFITKKIGKALLLIGGAILAVALAAKLFSTVDANGLDSVFILLDKLANLFLVLFGISSVIANLTALNGLKGIGALYVTLDALGDLFSSLGLALLEFAAAAALMDGIDIGNAIHALEELLGVVLILYTISALPLKTKNIAKLAEAFTTVAGSLLIFAVAARLLQSANLTNTAIALLELTTVVTVLSILNDSFDVKKIRTLASTFATISASLIVFSAAAALLNGADLSKTAVTLMELITVVSVLAILGDAFGSEGVGALSRAMIEISSAMLIFAAAGKVLNTVDWSSLLKMAAVLGTLVAVTAVFSAISEFLAPGLVLLSAFAKGTILLSVGMLAASVALSLFVASLGLLATMGVASIDAAILALDALLLGIASLGYSLEIAITAIIRAAIRAIVNSASDIGNAFKVLVLKLIEILDELIPTLSLHLFKWLTLILHDLIIFIGNTVATIFETLDKLINEYWPRLMNTLSMVWETFLTTVFGALAIFFETFLQAILNFVYDIAKFIRGLGDAIHEVFLAIDYLINDILLPDLIGLIVNTISTLAEEGSKAIGETFETIIGALIGLVVDIALAIPKRLKEGWEQLKEAWKNGFKGSVESDTDKMGEDAVDKLNTGITNHSWKLDSAARTLWDRIKGTFNKEAGISSPSIEMAKIGEYLTQGLGVGIKDGEGTPIDAMKNLASGVLNPDLFDAKNLGVGVGADFMSSLSTEDLTLVPGMDLDKVFEGKEDILETFDSIGIPDTTVTSYADNSLVTGAGMDEIAGAFADLNASSDVVVKTGMDNSYVEGEGMGGVKTAFKNLNESSDVDVVPKMELSAVEEGIQKIIQMIKDLNDSNDIVIKPTVDTSSAVKSMNKVSSSASKAYSSSVGGSKGATSWLNEFSDAAEKAAEASKELETSDDGWMRVEKYGKEYWIPYENPGRGENTKAKYEERYNPGDARGQLLDRGIAPAADALSAVASQIAADENKRGAAPEDKPSVSYTQNIYSPKSLSAIDIYRDTKNALSAVQGGV